MQGSYAAPAQGNLRFDIDVMETVAKYFRCTLRPQDPSLSHGAVYSWGAWRGFRTTVSALPGAFSGLMWRCPTGIAASEVSRRGVRVYSV